MNVKSLDLNVYDGVEHEIQLNELTEHKTV